LKKCLLLAFAFLYPLGSAHAQHPIVLQKLNEWNEATPPPDNETFKKEVLSTAQSLYSPSAACSTSQVLIEELQPATAERFVFSAVLNRTIRNAWTVIARLPGCDDVPARYMIMRNADDSIRTIRVNRGISYAWDSLISDTLPLVRLAALTALKGKGIDCGTEAKFKLGVTRIASEGKDLGGDSFGVRYAGTWSEIWPIETCNRKVEVRVDFTADGDGGAYSHIPGGQVAILPK